MVDKSQAARRELHFADLAAIARDVESVTAGPHHTTGNWTSGQIVEHLAVMFRIANHGSTVKLPWPVRVMGRVLKALKVHRRTIKPGLKLPPRVEREFVPPPGVELAAAKRHLLDEIAVAQERPMSHPSPLFGRMSHADWVALHCRHAELHLSFIQPGMRSDGNGVAEG